MKIVVTGSISSGKSTAVKFLSKGRYPIYSADNEVSKLYRKASFIKLIANLFKINKRNNLKKELKRLIIEEKINLDKLEKIIHPLIRKKMKRFSTKNKSKKFLIYEIPLLVEKNLKRHFDTAIFIGSSRKNRLKRYRKKGGSRKVFDFLDKRQLPQKKKIKFCNHVIVNNSSLNVLKKKILNIMSKYE